MVRPLSFAVPLVLTGCLAQPPEVADGASAAPGRGPYASIATCGVPKPCDASCAQKAVGAPDGASVDMTGCTTLQLTFTDGTLVPVLNVPDLAIHVSNSAGVTRIQASKDGTSDLFTDVGFVGKAPYPLLPPECEAQEQNNTVLVYIDRCGYQSDIGVIRLERVSGSGGLEVDAVEALNFKPIGNP
jgi:hypothetical protein